MPRMFRLFALTLLAATLAGCSHTSLWYRNEGRDARTRGDYAAAEAAYKRAVEINPSNYENFYWLGYCQLENGEYQDAQLTLERAWTLAPNEGVWTPKILEALAIALYKQPDKRQQLFTFLERQADATPTTPQFLRQARYLAMAGDADNANVAYIKAMQFAGDSSPQPFIEAARFYVARRDNDSALTALQYANYVDPGNAEVYALFRQIGVVPGPSQQVPPPDPGKYPAPRPYNGN